MIVNCETPRSVDVALQSLAAGNRKISPTMLERCDAWTLIRRRLESVDANGEQAEAVSALYKRALKSHVEMRQGADGLWYLDDEYGISPEQAQAVLHVQSCINRYDTDELLSSHANRQRYSIIHKLLEQLGPLDQRRSVLERCMLIGPHLLEFEWDACRLRSPSAKTGEGRTWSWKRPLEYNVPTTYQEYSKSLAEDIIQQLEQGITGETDMEPELLCILSASLVALFCRKMATESQSHSVFVGYLQRLIQAYRLRTSSNVGDTRHRLQNSRVSNELYKSMIILLLGALSISNSPCSVEKSACCFDSPSDEHRNWYHPSEKVLELVWKYLIGIIYSDTSSFNKNRCLIHGGLHLITRAEDYHLTPEDCMFISNLDKTRYYPSEIDDSCLVHHIQELSSALTPGLDLDALTPQLDACLRKLPMISYEYEYLLPTPELYVLIVKHLCQGGRWGDNELGHLLLRLPFPKASPQLIGTLSKSGILTHLVNSLESGNHGKQAFAIAQLWLLFNMSIQASDRTSPALNKLEKLLLQYPGLKNNPENQEEVAEELEFRLITLTAQSWGYLERFLGRNHILDLYLYRVLEFMLQQRYMPLPEKAHNKLQEVPERLRGIASFVDLEAEASGPSSSIA
ncbi:hypothetical protein FRC11_007391 [Ceratobasidium sp. 423]|nr:hypothetical protein FRC11_007391 [Ceratobasidium sp. 423]